VWNVQTGKQIAFWPAAAPQLAVAWSKNDDMLVAGGQDGTVSVYRLSNPNNVTRMQDSGQESHRGAAVNSVIFSTDGSLVIAAGLGGHVRAWDPNSGALKTDEDVQMGVTRLSEKANRTGDIAGWSGLMLTDGGVENYSQITTTGLPALVDLAVFHGKYSDWSAGAAYPGFPVLLNVWGPFTYFRYPAPYAPSGARSVAFSPDGKLLATGGNDRVVRVWRNSMKLFSDPCVVVPRNLNPQEWEKFLPGQPYKKLCPNLP
jgi:WD40 repeat protein